MKEEFDGPTIGSRTFILAENFENTMELILCYRLINGVISRVIKHGGEYLDSPENIMNGTTNTAAVLGFKMIEGSIGYVLLRIKKSHQCRRLSAR